MAHHFATGIFRPLEVREFEPSPNHHPRRRYLIRHAAGFTYLRTLKSTSEVTVVLARPIPTSLSPSPTRIIIKHYRFTNFTSCPLSISFRSELTISTLPNLIFRRPLPPNLYVFPTLLSYQLYALTRPDTYHAAVFYKYYNTGTLYDTISSYYRRGEPISEIFIWHVIARLTRAYSFLHTGRPTHQPHIADPEWNPIVHSDGHTANVFLHIPSPVELREDGSGGLAEVCRNGLPQVVLGNFGHAFSYSNDRSGTVGRTVVEGAPERATWRDKAQLGRVVMDMVEVGVERAGMEVDGGKMRGVYSDELVSVVEGFRPLVRWLDVVRYQGTEAGRTASEGVLAGFPTNEMVYGVLMEMADKKLEVFHAEKRRAEYGGLQEGVGASWVGFLG